jgi:multidrug efflux pump subunit AcrA (membrane-fusion protein)
VTQTPKTPRRSYLVPVVSAVVALLLGAGLLAALTGGDLSKPNDSDRAAAAEDFTPPTGLDRRLPVPPATAVGGAGVIEPLDRPVTLSVAAAGIVREVPVAEGQRVSAGAALIALDQRVAEATLAQAQGSERAARADVDAARAESAAASARATFSGEALRRTETLVAQGAATPDDKDRAVANATSDAKTAGAARARITQAQASLAAAAASRQAAQERLDDLLLRAPIDGEVLQILVRPGEYLTPGATAAVMGDTSRLRARLDIDERDAIQVAAGQRALIHVEGFADAVQGTVVQVARRVGRKNVRTDDPTDRQDARFVEVVVELVDPPPLPIGIRVDGTVYTE